MFFVYLSGRRRYPSDFLGDELMPIMSFLLSNIRFEAKRNVPSPPIGRIKSAHVKCDWSKIVL